MSDIQIRKSTIQLRPEIAKAQTHDDIGAYEVRPEQDSQIIGGLVIAQEIFGVNRHFKRLSDHYAKKGYWVITPAYFDHVERNLELEYDQASAEKGYGLMLKIGFSQMVLDTEAAGLALQKKLSALPGKKRGVGLVGFCLGGSLAWGVSIKTNGIFKAASAYYGSKIPEMKDLKANNPVIAHFGKEDGHIPLAGVEDFQKAHPEIPVYLYDAGHGFNCEEKKDFNPASAKLAEERTLDFFAKHLSE